VADRRSMVTILPLALIALTGIEQERITLPLICTEHAPHCATPHPYFVPVRPTFSRMTHSRGVSASTCTSRTLPLMLSLAMRLLETGDNGVLLFLRGRKGRGLSPTA